MELFIQLSDLFDVSLDYLILGSDELLYNGFVLLSMADEDFWSLIYFVKVIAHIHDHVAHSYKAIFYSDYQPQESGENRLQGGSIPIPPRALNAVERGYSIM